VCPEWTSPTGVLDAEVLPGGLFEARARNLLDSAAMTRRRLVVAALLLPVAVIAWHFPYASDDPVRREDAIKAFYEMTYTDVEGAGPRAETQLAKDAGTAAITHDVRGGVERFVQEFSLQRAAVLDVGSGSGYLQDVVDDYTGIDIARAAARFYHKRFVIGTATAMPFDDNAFDAAWSIWVIEHIPNPEAVTKGGRTRRIPQDPWSIRQPGFLIRGGESRGFPRAPHGVVGFSGRSTIVGITLWRLRPSASLGRNGRLGLRRS